MFILLGCASYLDFIPWNHSTKQIADIVSQEDSLVLPVPFCEGRLYDVSRNMKSANFIPGVNPMVYNRYISLAPLCINRPGLLYLIIELNNHDPVRSKTEPRKSVWRMWRFRRFRNLKNMAYCYVSMLCGMHWTRHFRRHRLNDTN